MSDLRKAAEQALSGLETIRNLLQESKIEHAENHAAMIELVLRQALAQEEQEPVQFKCTVVDDDHPNGVPLSQWGQQPEQEPVAWMYEWRGRAYFTTANQGPVEAAFPHFSKSKPLYTAPPKKEWVGLTDYEILDAADAFGSFQYGDAQGHKRLEFAKAIEAKLKRKNNG